MAFPSWLAFCDKSDKLHWKAYFGASIVLNKDGQPPCAAQLAALFQTMESTATRPG